MAGCRDAVGFAAVFLVWFALNVSINVYNKLVLSFYGFPYPLMLTASNKMIGWIGALVVLMVSDRSALPAPKQLAHQFYRPMVHAHGVITALNVGLNNWSLLLLSITINQLIKAVVPLPTAALSVLLERRCYSWHVFGSMIVIVLGTALAASRPDAEATPLGVVLCCGSVLCAAAWTVVSALLMQRGAEPLNSVSLLFVSSPTSIVCLLMMAACLELPAMTQRLSAGPQAVVASPAGKPALPDTMQIDAAASTGVGRRLLALRTAEPWGTLPTVGPGGFGYDIVHNVFLRMTSAVTMSVVGNAKLIVLIGISMATLERAPSASGMAGVALALAGCCWYTLHRAHDHRKRALEMALLAEGNKAAAPPKASSVRID